MSALVLGLARAAHAGLLDFSIRCHAVGHEALHGPRQSQPRTVKIGRWQVSSHLLLLAAIGSAVYVLTDKWLPLGPDNA
jgi:hypothetical protein